VLPTASTRERLVDAAMRLFSEQGYRSTTVGSIEAAAGLSPRAGGFYRHFTAKREILDVVIERLVGDVRLLEAGSPPADPIERPPRARLRRLGSEGLQLLRQQHPVIRLASRELEEAPEIAIAVRDGLVEPGYRFVVMAFAGLAAPEVEGDVVRFAAMMATASLVTYVNEEAVFGRGMTGVGEEELIEAWTATWARVLGISEG
jgi:AcrR family transcriptional regulator